MIDEFQATQSQDSMVDQALASGIRAARSGKRELARQLLLKVTELDPTREEAWLWLSGVAETTEEALGHLYMVLALNPDNQKAQEGLQWMTRQLAREGDSLVCPHCNNLVLARGEQCSVCGGELLPEMVAAADVPELVGEAELSPVSSYGEVPSLVLSVEQAEAIDACLESMADRSNARCIILADVSGQLIAERGGISTMNTQVLSALAAGELAATRELAQLVGERARFKLLLHEGETQSVYLSDVGEQLLVVIVFDNDTPIGLVRLVLRRAVTELMPILAQPASPSAETSGNGMLGGDFSQLLEGELDTSL